MNITITGNLGSGKTTVCNELKKLGFEIISAGDLFRSIAKERGLSVVELNELVNRETEQGIHDIDDMIDQRSTELGRTMDNTVFDSRLAWNFVESSFKVFLMVDIDEAASRILNANRETEQYDSLEDCSNAILNRQLLEQERFSQLYGINYYDMNNYNLIVETTHAAPEDIATKIVEAFREYQLNKFEQKVLLNPKSIYPTQSIRRFNENALNKYISDRDEKTYGSIEVTTTNNEWYVLDGHHRWIGSLIHESPFVEAIVKPYDVDGVLKLDQNQLYDFEDIGNFRYAKYPSIEPKTQLLQFCPSIEIDEIDYDDAGFDPADE